MRETVNEKDGREACVLVLMRGRQYLGMMITFSELR